jgi:hypothetical protein
MGVIRVAEKSAIQRIKDPGAERASIFDHAKEEALERAKAAVAELNGLGFNYTLTNGAGKQAKAGPGKGKGKGAIKAAACPICEFQTAPPHDGRTQRNQKKKGPFSVTELKEKGLVKVQAAIEWIQKKLPAIETFGPRPLAVCLSGAVGI